MTSIQLVPYGTACTKPSYGSGEVSGFVSGNADGEVHLYGRDTALHLLSGAIKTLVVSPAGDSCIISKEEGETLDLHEFPAVDNVTRVMVVRKELPVSQVVFDREGHYIFVASDAPNITIHSVLDERTSVTTIETFSVPVRTMALSPDGLHLSAIDANAKMLLFKLNEHHNMQLNKREYISAEFINSLVGLVEQGTVRSGACKLSWHPDANNLLMAAPGKKGCVTFFSQVKDQNEWKEVLLVGDSEDGFWSGDKDVTLVSFSPNGLYLATANEIGDVLVWQLNREKLGLSKPLHKFVCTTQEPLHDILWGPKEGDNYLVISTSTSWTKIEDVVASSLTAPAVIADTEAETVPSKASPFPSSSSSSSSSFSSSSSASSEVMDVDEETVTTSTRAEATAGKATEVQYKRLQKQKPTTSTRDDEDEDGLFEETTATVKRAEWDTTVHGGADSIEQIKHAARVKKTTKLDDDDDKDEESDGGMIGDYEQERALGLAGPRIEDLEKAISLASAQATQLQAPFQPSQTQPDDKRRRYLVWNAVGNITSREESDAFRIEIRFTNTMGRNKQEAFPDTYGFNKASLSLEGAIFASDPEELDAETSAFRQPLGSTIYYHAFPGQKSLEGANENFTTTLSEGEAALAVAVGTGWSAVATSKGFLRIFSSTGVQISITWLKGPVVTMCGSGTQLAVFYNAAPVSGTVNIRLDLFAIAWHTPIGNRCLLSEAAVPLTAKSQLEWVGFDTDSQLLTIIDTAGMMSMLMHPLGWQWIPVLDIAKTKKTIDHVYWPVLVKGPKLVYVLLNGESRPAVYPQPVVSVKHLRIPIAESIASSKQGKEKADAQNERSHNLLWETSKACHWETLKVEEDIFGLLSVEGLGPEQLEMRLSAQQNEADKTVLKMLQEACRFQRTANALDLAHKLRTEKGMQAAILIANQLGRPNVANVLENILEQKQLLLQQMQQQQQEETYAVDRGSSSSSSSSYTEEDAYADENATSNNIQVEEEQQEGGALSKRAYAKQVTPAYGSSSSDTSAKVITNPFLKSASSPAPKRKGYDLADLKGSPSPGKKPTLSRQSSFSSEARNIKSATKTLL